MKALALTLPKTFNLSFETRVKAFWTMVAIIVLSLFVYIIGVNLAARNVAEKQALERKMDVVSGSIDSLEFSYIELKNSVTVELARDYGFRDANDPLYVSRNKDSKLSFNSGR